MWFGLIKCMRGSQRRKCVLLSESGAKLVASKLWQSSCLPPKMQGIHLPGWPHPAVEMGAEDLNPGCHACTVSISHPQSRLFSPRLNFKFALRWTNLYSDQFLLEIWGLNLIQLSPHWDTGEFSKDFYHTEEMGSGVQITSEIFLIFSYIKRYFQTSNCSECVCWRAIMIHF